MYIPSNKKNLLSYGIPPTVSLKHINPNVPVLDLSKKFNKPPEVSYPSFINYYADLAGCGFWRIKWPEYVLNIKNMASVVSLANMVFDATWYRSIKSIKFQRQATDVQKKFFDDIKKLKQEFKYNIIYEIDDVVFGHDLPDYNSQKRAFEDLNINANVLYMMQNADELTLTTPYIKEYYKEATGHERITVIPNYIPKFWAGRLYNENKIAQNFDKNKKRPRVLYAGSGTHINFNPAKNISDDFSHVIEDIIKARHDFKFVWKGAYPLQLKPYIDNGDMEYHKWTNLLNLPQDIYDLNCNMAFAPLMSNTFNKCKSNIKMLEFGALGLPGVYQDLEPYFNAQFKFSTGAELIDQLKYISKNSGRYLQASRKAFEYTNTMWLEDHISEHFDVYNFSWGSTERNKNLELIKNNLDQKI